MLIEEALGYILFKVNGTSISARFRQCLQNEHLVWCSVLWPTAATTSCVCSNFSHQPAQSCNGILVTECLHNNGFHKVILEKETMLSMNSCKNTRLQGTLSITKMRYNWCFTWTKCRQSMKKNNLTLQFNPILFLMHKL